MLRSHACQILCAFSLLSAAQMARAEQAIEIQFGAAFGTERFGCGQTFTDVGTARSTVTPTDFRYYVHDVALLDANGQRTPVQLTQDGVWQYQNAALLDFEDGSGPCLNGNPALNASVRGTVPDGDYRGLEFTLGLPFELNHRDVTTAPSPLNVSAMFWNWQGGHRFLKVDLATSPQPAPMRGVEGGQRRMMMDGDGPSGFPIHLGSTGCASASRTTAPASVCANPNRVTVRFDGFDPAHHVAVADILAILGNTDVDTNTMDTAPGCMSGPTDPECRGVMAALGLGGDGGVQRLFRME